MVEKLIKKSKQISHQKTETEPNFQPNPKTLAQLYIVYKEKKP